MTLGEKVKLKREELGLSQEELAEKMNYKSKTSIHKIEVGITDLPLSKVKELAAVLKTTPAYLMGWEEKISILDSIALLSDYELEGLNKLLTGENSIESAYLSLDKKDPKEILNQILKSLKKERAEINLSKETHDFYINENLAGDIKYKNKKISIIMGDPKDKSTFKELDLNSDENIKLSNVISLIQLALEKVELDGKGRLALENLIGEIIKYDFASRENTILKVTPKKYDISQPDISDSINSSGLAAFSGNIKRVKK
ncbi:MULTISPECIES: helix-turn-helix domain-containing protein [Fusobacterium]|uniref:helix-turn-helix domain-containing protein n=1 Tax=Fusobacterium TaxID=848 RepID=UPI0030D53B88